MSADINFNCYIYYFLSSKIFSIAFLNFQVMSIIAIEKSATTNDK